MSNKLFNKEDQTTFLAPTFARENTIGNPNEISEDNVLDEQIEENVVETMERIVKRKIIKARLIGDNCVFVTTAKNVEEFSREDNQLLDKLAEQGRIIITMTERSDKVVKNKVVDTRIEKNVTKKPSIRKKTILKGLCQSGAEKVMCVKTFDPLGKVKTGSTILVRVLSLNKRCYCGGSQVQVNKVYEAKVIIRKEKLPIDEYSYSTNFNFCVYIKKLTPIPEDPEFY